MEERGHCSLHHTTVESKIPFSPSWDASGHKCTWKVITNLAVVVKFQKRNKIKKKISIVAKIWIWSTFVIKSSLGSIFSTAILWWRIVQLCNFYCAQMSVTGMVVSNLVPWYWHFVYNTMQCNFFCLGFTWYRAGNLLHGNIVNDRSYEQVLLLTQLWSQSVYALITHHLIQTSPF